MSKLALGAAYLCPFLYNCFDAIVAYLINVGHIPLYQIICYRNSITFLGYFIYLEHIGEVDTFLGPAIVRKWIWLRGIATTLALILAFRSLQYLSISEFATVFGLAPFGTALMCRIFVGERFPPYQIVFCLISFVGVILVVDPLQIWSSVPTLGPAGGATRAMVVRTVEDELSKGFGSKLIGLCFALPSVMMLSTETVIMRVVKDQASPSQINVIVSFCPAIATALIMLITRMEIVYPANWLQWLLTLGVLICGFLAQYTQTYSYARLSGIRTAIPQYTSLVNMPVLQWVIYGNRPNLLGFLGMGIVIVTGLFSVIRSGKAEDAGTDGSVVGADVEQEPMLPDTVPLLPLDPRVEGVDPSGTTSSYRA